MTKTLLEKRCSKCRIVYPATPEYFYRRKHSKDELNSYCKRCNHESCLEYGKTENGKAIKKKYQRSEKGKQAQRRYAATINGQQKRLNNNLRSKYGFTLKEYNKLFKQQNGQCVICGHYQSELSKRLHVDHDHNTGEIRGLLCDNCNRGIGHLKNSPGILQNAIEYLSRQ